MLSLVFSFSTSSAIATWINMRNPRENLRKKLMSNLGPADKSIKSFAQHTIIYLPSSHSAKHTFENRQRC